MSVSWLLLLWLLLCCVYGGYVTCFFDPVVADMLDTRSVCVCVGGGGVRVYRSVRYEDLNALSQYFAGAQAS